MQRAAHPEEAGAEHRGDEDVSRSIFHFVRWQSLLQVCHPVGISCEVADLCMSTSQEPGASYCLDYCCLSVFVVDVHMWSGASLGETSETDSIRSIFAVSATNFASQPELNRSYGRPQLATFQLLTSYPPALPRSAVCLLSQILLTEIKLISNLAWLARTCSFVRMQL